MPSRAVEAMLLLTLGLAATVVAYATFHAYLSPMRAPRLDVVKANIESLAKILDRGHGKFKSLTLYKFKSEKVPCTLNLKLYDSKGRELVDVTYHFFLPLVNTTIDARPDTRLLLRGSFVPYANTSASTTVMVYGDVVEIMPRPVVQVEDCSYYSYQCRYVHIVFPVLKLERSGKIYGEVAVGKNQIVDFYLNRSVTPPAVTWYGQKLVIHIELDKEDIFGNKMVEDLTLDLGVDGVFKICYTFNEIVLKS